MGTFTISKLNSINNIFSVLILKVFESSLPAWKTWLILAMYATLFWPYVSNAEMEGGREGGEGAGQRLAK